MRILYPVALAAALLCYTATAYKYELSYGLYDDTPFSTESALQLSEVRSKIY